MNARKHKRAVNARAQHALAGRPYKFNGGITMTLPNDVMFNAIAAILFGSDDEREKAKATLELDPQWRI